MDKYTLGQAARELGVSKSSLLRWERDGKIAKLKRLKRNGHVVLDGEDLRRIREWLHATEGESDGTNNRNASAGH